MTQKIKKGRKRGGRQVSGSMVAALLFGLAALLVQAWLPVAVLICQRGESGQVDCLLQRRMLGLIPLSQAAITGLKGAHADNLTQIESGGWRSLETRRVTRTAVVLLANSGIYTLTDYDHPAAMLPGPDQVAEQIGAFLTDPTGSRSLTAWQVSWVSAVLTGLSLIMLLAIAAARMRERYAHRYSL